MATYSPFCSLPDEIVLKIIAMAAPETHDFIVDTVPEVSERFGRIAADKSLWKGVVRFCGRGDQGPNSIDFFARVLP